MEAINRKEKSNKVWQFLGIFILPLILLSGILYAYQKIPTSMMEDNLKKAELGSSYSRLQKLYSNEIRSMDSIFNIIGKVSDETKQDELVRMITIKRTLLEKKDSSELVRSISKMINSHLQHLISFYNLKDKVDKARAEAIQKEMEKQLMQQQMQPGMPMPGEPRADPGAAPVWD